MKPTGALCGEAVVDDCRSRLTDPARAPRTARPRPPRTGGSVRQVHFPIPPKAPPFGRPAHAVPATLQRRRLAQEGSTGRPPTRDQEFDTEAMHDEPIRSSRNVHR